MPQAPGNVKDPRDDVSLLYVHEYAEHAPLASLQIIIGLFRLCLNCYSVILKKMIQGVWMSVLMSVL